MGGKWCLNFDGINDYVNCGQGVGGSLDGMAAITIETLIYPTALNNYMMICGKDLNAPNLSYSLFLSSIGSICGDISTPTDRDLPYTNENVSILNWFHITERWAGNGNNIEMLLNGALCTIAGFLAGVPPLNGTPVKVTTASLWLGRYEIISSYKFGGYIAYFRLWSEYRTDAQINQFKYRQINVPQSGLVLNLRMNEDSGDYAYDASGYGNDGYLGNGTPNYKPTRIWVPDCPIKKGRIIPMGQDGLAGARAIGSEGLAR